MQTLTGSFETFVDDMTVSLLKESTFVIKCYGWEVEMLVHCIFCLCIVSKHIVFQQSTHSVPIFTHAAIHVDTRTDT